MKEYFNNFCSGGMSKVIISLMLTSCFLMACGQSKDLLTSQDNFTVSFGSCNHQEDTQDIWVPINENHPNLWIWLGDIIYADTEDMNEMKAMYANQKTNDKYKAFMSKIPVIGVWDDHDYGFNDAGNEYPKRDSSADLLLDFLDVNENSPARHRQGVYQSYTYGEPGKQIKVILLDVRYFRDQPGIAHGSILGREQWDWLAAELSSSQAQIHLIGGGIQFLPTEHPYEKWSNFPGEKERLLHLMDSLDVPNPILLSGDRHFGEIMEETLPGGGMVYEVTSSGLTHSYDSLENEPNQYRIHDFTNQVNFGLARIDWESAEIRLEIRDKSNRVVIEHLVQF